MLNDDFYTFRGYMRKASHLLTPSMEDYIEMIYRLSLESGFTRVNELSKALNVQPPSATKMSQKFSEMNLINYEKYGVIILTEEGKKVGKFLLDRHNTLEKFLNLIAPTNDVLEQTEKLEHIISSETLEYIIAFVKFIDDNPQLINDFRNYVEMRKNYKTV
ncbi:metal-dependent transcriptional regulator [Clostridium ganghwense]|uniref:Manganese transport regulator n=1 Tax=Clostridium ganghwense TaxID=312089 RepID=A0ABT4CUD5_9CLOT|nr:iron dependent repressor, metal binding and dimerization domain protein [Clostridium ganghwense]MCY6372683.1 Fur family transcriptional regulator [Clostridium ganghwense]